MLSGPLALLLWVLVGWINILDASFGGGLFMLLGAGPLIAGLLWPRIRPGGLGALVGAGLTAFVGLLLPVNLYAVLPLGVITLSTLTNVGRQAPSGPRYPAIDPQAGVCD